MGGSVDEQTTKSVSSSRSPLPISGFNSLASSRSSLSKKTKSPEPEEVLAELLEKAKFYTSLCLGEFEFVFVIMVTVGEVGLLCGKHNPFHNILQ